MSQPRKATHRKTTASTSSSTQAALPTNAQELQSSAGLSSKRSIYPNVPKRKQRVSTTNQHEATTDGLRTASRIFFMPPTTRTSDTVPSFDQNVRTRRNLDMISKYTNPQDIFEPDAPSPSPSANRMHIASTSQPTLGWKNKRCLSPLNEINRSGNDSKRTRSFHDDEDDEELSQLLDHRHQKSINSSQTINESEAQIAPGRKPTARKLSISQRKSVISPLSLWSQPASSVAQKPHEPLIIQLDAEPTENESTGFEDRVTHSSSTPKTSPADQSLVQSASSHGGERRSSWASSNSLVFDTPRSSFSRTTTNQTISYSPPVMKNDAATEVSSMSNLEMITQLIAQTKLNAVDHQLTIDFTPIEVSSQLFRQSTFVSSNTNYQTRHSWVKQQFLRLGRYEIEVLFPGDHDRISTIYACDLCLKHFHGSSMASQRHASKCLSTRPPGSLVFAENEFGIFQIGQTSMNVEERIYIKSLCRVARLFVDPNRSVDDTKIDRFAYYILCRRDPVFSPSQTPLYRFVGYFSKLRRDYAQQSCAPLSCLFVVPPSAHQHDYYQLLITFSYCLIRSNVSETMHYSSPVGQLDRRALSAFQTYCRQTIFTCLEDLQSIALDTLARRTLIHPRDLLSSLYSTDCLASHPTETSSVYLCNYAQHATPALSSQMKTKLFDTHHETKVLIGQENNDRLSEEIVLE